MLTQLESIRDEAFGSMQYVQRDLRMQLGTFDRLDAGPSSHTDMPRQAYVQRVHSGGQRNRQGGRRRPRVRQPADADDHAPVHQHVDDYVPTVQYSSDTFIPTATGVAQSSFFPMHDHSTYDPFRTPTQIPAFGSSSDFATPAYGTHPGDDFIYDYLAYPANFATSSHQTSVQVDTWSSAIPSPTVPQSCPQCGQTPVPTTSEDDDDDEPPLPVQTDLGQRRSLRQQAHQQLPRRRTHWRCDCSTTPRDRGRRHA